MGKRPATTLAAEACKAAKQDPVACKAGEVAAALAEATVLPEAVRTMLSDMLPFSLRLPREQRDAYQQEVVEMVQAALSRQAEALERAIPEAEGAVQQLAEDKQAQEAGLARLDAELAAKGSDALERRRALADAALAFRAAKGGLAEAEAGQLAAEAELDEAAKGRVLLSSAISDVLEPLVSGALAGEAAVTAAEGLMPTLQRCFRVEESLVPCAATALAKEPSARGPFDITVAVQLQEQAKAALEASTRALESATAAKVEKAAALEAAKEALAAASRRQLVDAGAFEAARTEEESVRAAIKAGKQALKGFGPEHARRAKAVARAAEAFRAFREGPLAALGELAERSGEAAAPAAEEAAEEKLPEGAAQGTAAEKLPEGSEPGVDLQAAVCAGA